MSTGLKSSVLEWNILKPDIKQINNFQHFKLQTYVKTYIVANEALQKHMIKIKSTIQAPDWYSDGYCTSAAEDNGLHRIVES